MKETLREYLESLHNLSRARFHMPGHKGRGLLPPFDTAFPYDITEITGADSLYEASGVLARGEEATAALFGSAFTLWSAGGSTLCIQAMLALSCREGDTVLALRNAHHAFSAAAALLGLNVSWLLPEKTDGRGLWGRLSVQALEKALSDCPQAKAVWITSPDYLGGTQDVAALAEVCHAHGTLLLVDAAHGSYLLCTGRHPLQLGADLCCDSPHKTLPVLTGGAWLHAAKGAPFTPAQGRKAMKLFGSTSPSYLILLSLDDCTRALSRRGREELLRFRARVLSLREKLETGQIPLLRLSDDYAKLTLDAPKLGYLGTELGRLLEEAGMDPEYADERFLVLMLSPQNTEAELDRLSRFLLALPKREPIAPEFSAYRLPPQKMSLRRGYFARSERVKASDCLGRICAEDISFCPPGVPAILPGEEITSQTISLLLADGRDEISVVRRPDADFS